ncbi:MAG: hypothetical protein ABR529_06800 [Actinomycetota bacterium]
MERGSDKHGSRVSEQLEEESEPLERSLKESHVESEREKESGEADMPGSGHRISGTGSSADEYPLKDHGEEGGASHPKPKDAD